MRTPLMPKAINRAVVPRLLAAKVDSASSPPPTTAMP